jgi:hypothetical protein
LSNSTLEESVMAIERELPPGIEPALAAAGAGAGADRADPLDIALVEHYLACTRRGDEVRVDSLHLAQLCNEVWRRRREENERGLGRVMDAANANRMAHIATKAIANVGHARPFEGHQHEATAIVQVANMLAELMQWRSGERAARTLDSEKGQAKVWEAVFETIKQHNPTAFDGGGSGASLARAELERLYQVAREAESAKRIISELERMGWLMKAAKP